MNVRLDSKPYFSLLAGNTRIESSVVDMFQSSVHNIISKIVEI